MKLDEATQKLFDAAEASDISATQVALAAGADKNARNTLQETPLHVAVISGNEEIAQLLIDKGADLNATDEEQRSALHWAVIGGQTNSARLLIKKGADISALDEQQKTPLDWAAAAGHTDIVALLEAAAQKAASHADRVTGGRNADEQRQR